MRVAQTVLLTDEQRATLERWLRGRSTPVRMMERTRIILMAAEGITNEKIAVAADTDSHNVARWRRHFLDKGLPGLEKGAPRSGRKPTRRDSVTRQIIERTTGSTPENATHWSVRTLAEDLAVMHFIPTSSSWLNLIERWFRDLTYPSWRIQERSTVYELYRCAQRESQVLRSGQPRWMTSWQESVVPKKGAG